MLKIGGHLQFGGLVAQFLAFGLCRHELNPPRAFFFLKFQSTLLTPSQLKPATFRAWGVGTGL